MDQWERNQFSKTVGRDFYDVEPAHYGRPGGPGKESRSWYEVTQDTAKAMGEDYDVREYLRYTGGELPKTDEEIYNLHQAMKKDHKQNSGGAYNSRSDMAGVSQRAFEDYHANMAEDIIDDVMSQIPDNDADNKEGSEDSGVNNQSLEEAYNTGNLSPSFMDALNTRKTTAQQAAQDLLATTVQKVADEDDDGLLNTDKYLIDYSQPYNGLSGLS